MTYDCFFKLGQAWGSSIAALIIAAVTGIITWYFNSKQKKLAEERLRRDLFERRYSAWQSAQTLWDIIYRNESLTNFEELRSLASKSLAEVQSTKLLFTDELVLDSVDEYLNECNYLLSATEVYRSLPQDPELYSGECSQHRSEYTNRVLRLHKLRDSVKNEIECAMRLKETF